MRIGAIIQARTSSTRLPKKVLKKLPYDSDICVLQQVIRRVSKSKLLDEVIIATTTQKEDVAIVDIAKKEDVKYYRGSLDNVLERYYKAASENNLDIVVRITSDCPCIDFEIIDEVIQSHLDSNSDYTSNALILRYPIGIGVEVVNFESLKRAYAEASEKYELEHVTPFIYKTHPEVFNINKIKGYEDNSDIRITLDTPQDYALICAVYDYLYDKKEFFLLNDILELFKDKPWLKHINEDIVQKKVCNNLSEELEEVINLCDMQNLDKAKDFIENYLEK